MTLCVYFGGENRISPEIASAELINKQLETTMNKKEVSQRVLQNGKPLDESKFTWDEVTKTFSSNEDGLVIDFRGIGNCTFDTGSYCTFKTGYNCVIVRRDMFEVVILKDGGKIQTCPYQIKGHLTWDGEKWLKDGVEHIIIDGVLSRVISHKGNVYKVINHNESEESYIVTNGVEFAHGKTIQEAKESLIFKISDRNTDAYKSLTLDSIVTIEEGIKLYRKITGACESQTKEFVKNLANPKESYSIKEIIELTEGRYNNNVLKTFFNYE